ncbi:MAG: hypothetical protein ACHQQS_03280 [Thermoanaerobaculales bacterium]
MDVKVTVKRKIRYQGKEYESIDELPEAVRQAYERAMAGGGQAGFPTAVQSQPGKIVFNGHEYGGIATMPPDVRNAYEGVMRAVVGGQPVGATVEMPTKRSDEPAALTQAVSAAPIEPGAALAPRTLVLLILGIVLLMGLLVFFLFQRPGG